MRSTQVLMVSTSILAVISKRYEILGAPFYSEPCLPGGWPWRFTFFVLPPFLPLSTLLYSIFQCSRALDSK
jgi:hypothetical protein